MLNRNVSLAVCLGVFAGATFAQSNQGTGYIFQFANSGAASGQFQAFIYNTQSLGTPVFSGTGPSGADQVVPKPDGSKFYVVGPGGVYDFNPAFTTSAALNGITGTPTQAVISPDGRYLLVASNQGGGAGSVFIVNTTNDAVVLNEPVNGTVVSIVVSRDSQTAWILGRSSQAIISIVTLPAAGAPQQVGSPVFLRDPISGDSLAGDAQAMTLSPLGLLYVSAGNQILEINPSVLTAAEPTFNEISIFATAGPLQFSTDGTMAYFINTTVSSGGPSLLSMAIPSHTLTPWPTVYVSGQTQEQFDSILIASPTRLFAHSPADNTLWDVAPDFSSVGVSALNTVLPATNVFSVALSNELPSAQYLYALIGSGSQASIYRVVLSTNTVNSQASAALGPGTLQFAIVPPETNPTGFIQYNATQTNLAPGAKTLPLIARVLDPTGRPVFAVPVSFTGDPSLTIIPANSTTNEDGFVQAIVTMGPTTEPPGNYPVTLTAGSGSNVATATFTLSIPGAGSTGPTGGGPNQMTIVSGNGGLYQAQTANNSSLVVQLLDTNGHPLVNQSVTFTVVGTYATSAAVDGNTTTDTNGLASTGFYAQSIPQNTSFVPVQVTAVAAQGAVTFNETVWQPDPNSNNAQPSAYLSVPTSLQTINAGEGSVLPGAIQATVFAHGFGTTLPIPNVAINITNSDNSGNPGPATCQGNPLTDQNGNVTCNLIPVCSTAVNASTMLPWGLGFHGFNIDFGGALDLTGYSINITSGSGQSLVISSGNNQSGRPGGALSAPLMATVTDQCGASAAGVTVTWKVTQGSAVLSTATTVSNAGGNVSTQLTLGQTPGTVQVVASINSTNSVTFTETIQAVVGSLNLISGGGQSALEGQAFASPLVFQVKDTNNNPVPGLTVNFSLASGTASISTTSGTTNSTGQASVSVTAGNVAGPVTVTATYGTLTASATLSVTAPGLPLSASSFVSAASTQQYPLVGLAPCGLAQVSGSGLAPGISGITYGSTLGIAPWPYTLATVSITVNGTPAPIQAVSNQGGLQTVNFQTPCETVPGSPATVVVQVGASTTQVTGVTVYPAQPAIIVYQGSGGTNYPDLVDSNGNLVTPSNPATAGQTYFLIVTGMGQTIPAASTNSVGTGEIVPASNVILAINNVGVPVSSVQYQQGARGVYIIAFTLPVPFATGNNLPLNLEMTVNGQTFPDTMPVVFPSIH